MPKLGRRIIAAFIRDALKVRLSKNPRLEPLLLTYFVTFRCNCSCIYCGYTAGSFSRRYPEIKTPQAKRIIEIFREAVQGIAFSGGEPLIRDDIVELIRYARSLGYKPISLFTNALLLPQKEEVLDSVDFLQISLDTVNVKKQDWISGRSDVGIKVIESIQKYAPLQKKKGFRININCVIGRHNLDDVERLVDFAESANVRMTVSAQLDDRGKPVAALRDNESYSGVIDSLIAARKHRPVLMDLLPFLERLRDFGCYSCFPALSLRAYPDGSLVNPCPGLNENRVNVLEAGSWRSLKLALEDRIRSCPEPCFLPCYLETSLLVKNPFVLLKELWK